MLNYTNDSIKLSYFFDLIEIEIHASNIASFSSTRGVKDSFINRIMLKSKLQSDAYDNHVKFCCKLIEMGIDLNELNKKYKNIDDLPIVCLMNYYIL